MRKGNTSVRAGNRTSFPRVFRTAAQPLQHLSHPISSFFVPLDGTLRAIEHRLGVTNNRDWTKPLPEIELQPSCLLHYHKTVITSPTPCTTLTSTSLYEMEFVTSLSLRLISHIVSCTLVDRYQHFGEACCLLLQARKVKTMATDCFGRDTFHKTVSFVLIPKAALFQ
jgi:hypothetical protein